MNEMARFQRSPVKEPDMLSGICGSLCPIYGPWSCHKALMTLMKKTIETVLAATQHSALSQPH